MIKEIIVKDLSGLQAAAKEFLNLTSSHKLIAFYAPMGAGKTTFTTALCRELGVKEDAVSSPTFAIVNEYRIPSGESVYHFDFYRIEKAEEALDIGLFDYLDSGSLCLMEWPENIEELLPEDCLKVHIEVLPNLSRKISWEERVEESHNLF